MRRNISAVIAACAVLGLTSSAWPQVLDTTTFVVMGEGLAAGMANYGLSFVVQDSSFPAQVSRQMRTAFPQPLMQPPGIGNVVGYPDQTARMPIYPQGTVRVFPPQKNPNDDAPTLFVLNLSVPGFTLDDALKMQPQSPVVQEGNFKQTVTNMILGFPALILNNNVPLWTQFEYAKSMFPTVALVALGYYEAVDAAVTANPGRIPDPATFGSNLNTILSGLRSLQAQVIVATIPNPIDTAYFTQEPAAARILFSPEYVLLNGYNLTQQDYVTRNGLSEISNQFQKGKLAALPAGSTLPAATATDITNRVAALNARIATVAKDNGAQVYDLAALFRRIRVSGTAIGTTQITADYMGGFYSLDCIYPGITGHALIANDLLGFLNRTYSTTFPLLNLDTVLKNDPGHQYARAGSVGNKPSALWTNFDQ